MKMLMTWILLMLAALVLSACPSPSKTALSAAADADYLAEQLACVDQAGTRDQATACRNAVKARWAANAADGGAR